MGEIRQLEGLNIVVAGGHGGLGAALSAGLADRGAQIVIADMRTVESSGHRQVVVDMTSRESVAAAIEDVQGQVGRIDGLVNAAGITSSSPFLETSGDSWDRVLGVNLTGAFNLCQAVAGAMAQNAPIQGSRGSIVNIASLCSKVGCQFVAAYSASKSGLLGLTRVMAMELGPLGIRANAILPGVFLTELNADRLAGTARGDGVLSRTPAGRFGEAHELVPAVAMLLSREASFINGVELPVDGGYLATGISEPAKGVSR